MTSLVFAWIAAVHIVGDLLLWILGCKEGP